MNDRPDKPTILIVDDAPVDRALLARIFAGEYQVETAGDGAQALEMLTRLPEVSAVLLDIMMPALDGYSVLEAMHKNSVWAQIPVMVITAADDLSSQIRSLDCGAVDVIVKPVHPQVVLHRLRNIISRMELIRVSEQNRLYELKLRQRKELLRLSEIDEKTGIFNRQVFCRKAEELLQKRPDLSFVILRWDIDRFKIFNDTFGTEAGDALLASIGSLYRHTLRGRAGHTLYGHWEADHFVLCRKADGFNPAAMVRQINQFLSRLYPSFGFVVRLGIYPVANRSLEISLMCDRALLALHSIKGSFNQRFAYYDESMRSALLNEQIIAGEMCPALTDGQFHIYFQPQYDYVTGKIAAAEALVRWHHPQRGVLSPATFIPTFERSGFITHLDAYVWEQVCILLRKWLDSKIAVVPVSVNLSRRDIYFPDLVSTILALTEKYRLTPELLRLEITESAYMDNPAQLIEVVEQLRAHGFLVEMDDFGSGYSSLNTLKDVPVDVLKLDMKFVSQSGNKSRGGSILSSVVRMAHWLKLWVIAEGVETQQQADYLKSIGCFLMQGFYFFKPMPVEEYEQLLTVDPQLLPAAEEAEPEPGTDIRGAADFLDASTQATLLFNSFVGGAAILEYEGDHVEALRLNDKYFDVLGTTREEYLDCQLHILDRLYGSYREIFIQALESAIELGKETQCELRSKPLRPNGRDIWTMVRVRYLAHNVNRYTFYISVENITERRQLMTKNIRLSRELSTVISNVPGGIINFEISDHIHMIYFNDTAAAMFGYSRAEYAEQFSTHPLRTVHPDDIRQYKMELKCTIKGRKSLLNYKYRHICKGGGWRWVQLTGRVMYRGAHSILTSAILIDINKQVQAELLSQTQAAELEKQRLFLHSLYNTVPCGIIRYTVKNRVLTLLSCNRAAWRIFGYENKAQCLDSIGSTGRLRILYPNDVPLADACVQRALEGKPVDFEHRIIRWDGKVRWLRMLIQKIHFSDSSEALQCVFTDITKQRQDELQRYSGALFGIYHEIYELDLERGTVILLAYDCAGILPSRSPVPLEKWMTDQCKKALSRDDAQRVRDAFAFFRRGQTPSSCITEYRTGPEDHPRWTCMLLLCMGGSTYLACFRDTTDEKQAVKLIPLPTAGRERRVDGDRSRIFAEHL